MLAFAGNSLLNRLALLEAHIGPAEFAALRVISGAVALWVILAFKTRLKERTIPGLTKPDLGAIISLSFYMICFSFAYVTMDAGLGAIILFGLVQVTMFFGALFEGERPTAQRWIGTILAFAGVVLLSLPDESTSVSIVAVALMASAAIGWGIYSLIGRRVEDPLATTCSNFAYCIPVVLVTVLIWHEPQWPSVFGIILAISSGIVTSAMGYALWYALLPELGATRSALSQLSVPAIALVFSISFLGELATWVTFVSASMIAVGVAVGLMKTQNTR